MLEVLTIFLGAALVFLVQPLIGNTLLPTFGGTAAVWSVCLAAFQLLLVGGYFYAHLAAHAGSRSKARVWAHAALLFAASGWLCFAATHFRGMLAALAEHTNASPALGALVCVIALVAFPYIILSANSSLVQELSGGRYKLYAVSNLGSLLGLVVYPFVFERFMPLSTQWLLFAALSFVYAILFSLLAARTPHNAQITPHKAQGTTHNAQITYFLLSFVSCYLLNAVSTHLCTDITPLPMLWVGLLAAYLLSYILAFTDRGSRFAPWAALVVVPLACYGAWHFGAIGYTAFLPELYIGFSILFFGGWIVHSRLYRMRPDADGLTRYYLMIALGGAAGGAACSFLMPLVTNIVAEYPIALAMILGVVILDCRDGIAFVVQRPAVLSYIERTSDTDLKQLHAFLLSLTTPHPAQSTKHTAQNAPHPAQSTKHTAQSTTILLLSAFALYGIVRGYNAEGRVLCRYRNFYGLGYVAHKMMSVDNGNDYEANEFRSNGTIHGFQCARGKWKSQVPTVYYAEHAGGLPILKHPNRTPHTAQSTPHPAQSTLHKAQSTLHPAQSTKHKAQDSAMRVALCGMGIGTLASYAREGDFYRFYEINPAVAKIASDERYYTFLSEASGKVEVVLDDARHALAREIAANEPKYDVIVVDVFNGDAIPPHMATREAFQIYLDRLAPNGILAFHLSNWHLDLLPMVKAAAKEFNLSLEAYVCRPTLYAYASTWAFLSREPLPPLYDEKAHDKIDLSTVGDIPLMTDDFHSLLPYLRLNVSVKKKE